VQRREVDEGARRRGRADLDQRGRDLGVYPVAEHGLGHRPVQRGPGRRGVGQRDRLAEHGGQDLVDAGIGAGHGLPVGQRDPGGVVQGLGGQGEHVPPQPRVLRARHLAGQPADDGQAPVPRQPAAAHLGRVQVLAQHGLDRVPAQYGHGS
jgi:hypothetical protein